MTSKLIAVFVSTHETLRAERALKEAGVRVRATVKPRTIGSNCQMALAFPEERRSDVLRIARGGGFALVGVYRQVEGGGWAEAEG